MSAERTLIARWKGEVDPSLRKAADAIPDASGKAAKKSTAIWAGAGAAIGTALATGLSMAADKAAEFIGDSARAASDLKESVNVTQLTFGKQAAAMDDFFKRAAGNIGMSETAAREAASSVGGLLLNMGLGKSETVDWSKKLLTLSADMGSAFNADPAEAIEAIGAGLRGESEPLRRFNVMLSAEAIAAEAAAMGLTKKGQKLSNAAKAQAALSLITKQTARVNGDFKNTSDGAANAARIQAAKIEDLKAKIGAGLLPVQEKLLGFMNDQLIPGISGFVDWLSKAGSWVDQNKGSLAAFGVALGIVAGGMTLLSLAQSAAAAGGFLKYVSGATKATKAWAIVQAGLNLVMSANPIALVVIGIAALVAGLVVAYQNCEEFRRVVDTSFAAVGAAGRWLWNNALRPAVQAIVRGFAWVVDGLASMLDALGNVPGFGWAKTAAAGLRSVADSARRAADGIAAIPDPQVDTGQSRGQIAALDKKIRALKGKVVEAKAKGNTKEVERLQKKIRDLQNKTVQIKAELKASGNSLKVKVGGGGGRVMLMQSAGGILAAVKRFAAGGLENHRAQIAPAGAWRVWAEPETGGEAYIPLASSKRARSRSIWWETGRRLGVVPFADGGMDGGSAGDSREIADLLRQLLQRAVSREDLAKLIDATRAADPRPRRLSGVTL